MKKLMNEQLEESVNGLIFYWDNKRKEKIMHDEKRNVFVYAEKDVDSSAVFEQLETQKSQLETISVIRGVDGFEAKAVDWAKQNGVKVNRCRAFAYQRVRSQRDIFKELIKDMIAVKMCYLVFQSMRKEVKELMTVARKFGVTGQVYISDKKEWKELSPNSLIEAKKRQEINYDSVASISGEYQIYNEMLIQLYYSEELTRLEKHKLVKMLPLLELYNNRDGNYALSKKYAGEIWLIERDLVGKLGMASRFVNPKKFMIALEKAVPQTKSDARLQKMLRYMASLLIKYGIEYKPSERLLGRVKKEKGIGGSHPELYKLASTIANKAYRKDQFKYCEDIPAFNDRGLSTVSDMEDLNLDPADFMSETDEEYVSESATVETAFALLRFEPEDDSLVQDFEEATDYQSFDNAYLVPIDVVKEAINQKRPHIDHTLLQLFKIRIANEFYHYLDQIIPFAKNPQNMKVLKELNDISLELFAKPLKTADSLKGKVDRRSFSSPNRPGSKWFISDEIIKFGEGKNQQIAIEATEIFPFISITNFDRFSHFSYIRSHLLEEGDKGFEDSYLRLKDSDKEIKGNLATAAFVDKDWYHPSLGVYSLVGDAVVRTSGRLPEYGKIDLLAKAKGIIVDRSQAGDWEFEMDNGQIFKIDMIVNDQNSRETKDSVVGSAAARMRNYLGDSIEPIDVKNPSQVKKIASESIEKCQGRILFNGEVVCEKAIIGIAKFSYDDSQDYAPQLKQINGSYVQFQQRLIHNTILNENGQSGGFDWSDYLNLAISPVNQFKAFMCAKAYKTLEKLTVPPANEMAKIKFPEEIQSQLKNSKWQKVYNNIWFGDFLIMSGYFGKDIADVALALDEKGDFENAGTLIRAEMIYDICTHGVEIKLPWQTMKVVFPSPVMLTDDGTYMIQSANLKFMLRFLSMLGNYIKNPTKNLYESILKTLEDLKWSFLIQFTEKLLKNRGHTIAARSATGNKDLDKVIYPMESLIEFVGYEKIGRYWRKTKDSWKRRSRREQLGEDVAKQIDKAIATSKNDFHLQCSLNRIIKNILHLLFRHPVLGALPDVTGRVIVKANLHTIIVPQDLADRFTGLNSDDDGDIVYLLPHNKH